MLKQIFFKSFLLIMIGPSSSTFGKEILISKDQKTIRPTQNDMVLTLLPARLLQISKKGSTFVLELEGDQTCTTDISLGFAYNEKSCGFTGWAFVRTAGGEGWCNPICEAQKQDDLITITYSSSEDSLCKTSKPAKLNIRPEKNHQFIYRSETPEDTAPKFWVDSKARSKVKTVLTDRPCEGP